MFEVDVVAVEDGDRVLGVEFVLHVFSVVVRRRGEVLRRCDFQPVVSVLLHSDY